MLALALLILAVSSARARTFNITHLLIPEVVEAGQDEVEIECQYDAHFTVLNWFKGPNEFFRYKPGTTPSTRSFPVLGVGKIDMMECGPVACRLKLGGLTEEATGLYRCDIERVTPPYKFATRSAYMQVHGYEHRRPILEGVAAEYSDGENITATCQGMKDAELRWYINGREIMEMRGSKTFVWQSSRLMFFGMKPIVTLQCAEFRYGKLLGSKEMQARWKSSLLSIDERPQEECNSANRVIKYFSWCTVVLFLSFHTIID